MENVLSYAPLVSVVMCCYNSEQYIKETIDSVLNQTFKDFEFIIWNDGSSDSTESIVRSYVDKRISYFYHENTGLGKALNFACNRAKGKYIARIDADDICVSDRLQQEFDYLESHPSIVLVSSSVIYIDKIGKEVGRSFPWTWHRNIRKNINIVHPAAMFRKDVYMSTCGYQDIHAFEDGVLWRRMIQFGDFHIITTPLIYYRLLAGSLSHANSFDGPYNRMLLILRDKMLKDNVLSEIDIDLQNRLYSLAKIPSSENGIFIYRTTIEERIYLFLKIFFSKELSSNITIFLKNVYSFFRY